MNVHILNGDALRSQFPGKIDGEIIVLRECLVDGDVSGTNLNDLFHTRSNFLAENYGGNAEDYYIKFVPEVEKILSINPTSEICLWFEDDLFCQVNLWFTLHLLSKKDARNPIFLIRPSAGLELGFGGMNNSALIEAYENKILITDLNDLGRMWTFYQSGDLHELLHVGQQSLNHYPFILPAVEAHVKRQPDENGESHLHRTLTEIRNELRTNEFGAIFREFQKRESIYGFGDLQVRRLLNELD